MERGHRNKHESTRAHASERTNGFEVAILECPCLFSNTGFVARFRCAFVALSLRDSSHRVSLRATNPIDNAHQYI